MSIAMRSASRRSRGEGVNYSFRIPRTLKDEGEMLYRAMGMNLPTAFQIFLTQSIAVGGLPFELKLPLSKKENYDAWLEAREIEEDESRTGVPLSEAFAELAK